MPPSKKNTKAGGRKSQGTTSQGNTNGEPATTILLRATAQPNVAVDPLLSSFPGGLPAALQQSDADPQVASIPHFRVGRHGNFKIIQGKDHACEYSGAMIMTTQALEQQQPQQRPSQMLVGIYDKHKQQLVLQPTADHGYVYAMSQSVPTYQTNKPESNSGARQALFADFGSAKKRKVMRSQEANRVNVESVVGAGKIDTMIMQDMSASHQQAVQGGLTAVEQANLAWRQQFLPAFNEHADSPDQVYSAKKIAGPAAWTRLSNQIAKCLERENVLAAIVQGPQRRDGAATEASPAQFDRRKQNEWYPCVERLLKMLVGKGHAAKDQLVCTLLLNNYLHLYLQLSKKKFIPGIENNNNDRPRYLGVSMDVAQRWIECFTTPMAGVRGDTGHVMSKANKDSCLVHMFLLLLMAEGGNRMKSDGIQELADDLQMDSRDAAQLLRLAGCTVSRKGPKQTSAVLTTPLKFPNLKKGSRR